MKTKALYTNRNVAIATFRLASKFQKANWKWASVGIPKKEDIERIVHELAKHAMSEHEFCATGGLYAEFDKKSGYIYFGVDQPRHHSQLVTLEEWNSWFAPAKRKPRRMIQI